jgi:hypothetical protein
MKMTNKIVTVSFLCILYGCFQSSEPENIYLPESFTGPVIIIFDQLDGSPKKFTRAKRRIYQIPNSGVLKTELSKTEYNTLDQKIFRVNSFGEVIDSVDFLIAITSPQMDEEYISHGTYGSYKKIGSHSYTYRSFYVDKHSKYDPSGKKKKLFVDSVLNHITPN